MQEIVDDLWQMTVESRGGWQQNYFFVKRPFGNTLVYASQKYDYASKFLESFGGVARQLAYSLDELGSTQEQIFVRFGAAVNLCYPSGLEDPPFREKVRLESLAENDYSDPQLAGFSLEQDDPFRSLYLLKHKGKTVLFSGELLVLDEERISLGPDHKLLEKHRLLDLLDQLKGIDIDVLAPRLYRGSFNHLISLPQFSIKAEFARLHDGIS